MRERLEHILEIYGISASKLAEMLDVQRSGISHILAGRNNPSYEFLVRITENFPEIDANWLLTGKGSMTKGKEDVPDTDMNQPAKSSVDPEIPGFSANNAKNSTQSESGFNPQVYKSKQSSELEPESIIILHKDGTFRRYKPE